MATAPKRTPEDPEPAAPPIERGRGLSTESGADPEAPEPTRYTHEHPTLEEIAAEAYAIYIANGSQDGRDLDDWLEAERRIATRRV